MSPIVNRLTIRIVVFEGGLMHLQKYPLILAAVFSVAILSFVGSGCGKKQKPVETKTPQLSRQSKPAADTTDIFKEFYSDDTAEKKSAPAKKEKPVSKKEKTEPNMSSSSSYTADFTPNGAYAVQISCVRSQSFANKLAEQLKDKGYPAYVSEVTSPTPDLSGTFYRVRIGGFAGISSAKEFGQSILVPGGYQYWVDKKSNDNVGMEGYGMGSGAAGSSATSSYVPAAPANTPAPSSDTYTPASNPYASPSPASEPPATTSSSSAASQPAATSATSATTSSTGATESSAATSPASSTSSSSTSASSTTTAPATSTTTTPAATGSTGSTTTDTTSKSGW
jgi:hypothetical protein